MGRGHCRLTVFASNSEHRLVRLSCDGWRLTVSTQQPEVLRLVRDGELLTRTFQAGGKEVEMMKAMLRRLYDAQNT